MLELRKPSARTRQCNLAIRGSVRDETGVALLIAVIFMLLISAIGLGALQSASGESSAGSRSMRKVRTLFAADSALGLVRERLDMGSSQYPDTTALDSPEFLQNDDLFTAVRTGTSDTAVPQEILLVGRTRRDGDQLNINSGNSFTFGIYRTDVLATDPAGGRAELQAQYRVSEGADTYR